MIKSFKEKWCLFYKKPTIFCILKSKLNIDKNIWKKKKINILRDPKILYEFHRDLVHISLSGPVIEIHLRAAA